MITVEQLSPRRVRQLKMVRLSALQDEPTAFTGTYATESELSDEDWRQRVSTWNSDRSVCYIAMENDAPCGIIAGKVDESNSQHAWVLSMWVAPGHRRTGLGGRLVNGVQQWALKLGLSELRLMVTSKNEKAIRFYEKCGFVFTGMSGPYANDPALAESEMVKYLRKAEAS